MSKTPDDLLIEKGELFRKKGEEYGHTYKDFGEVMAIHFPNGLTLKSPEDFNRFSMLMMINHKLLRYTKAMEKGGHLDSAQDMQVYGAMLEEFTTDFSSMVQAEDVTNKSVTRDDAIMQEFMEKRAKDEHKSLPREKPYSLNDIPRGAQSE